jgi:hypothetical protein
VSRAVAALLPKLAPIIARMSTPHEGERLGCISAMERLLVGQRLDFNDFAAWLASPLAVANGSPRRTSKYGPTREPVSDALLQELGAIVGSNHATEREAEIGSRLLNQFYRYGGLTQKQLTLARDIVERVRARAEGGAS